MSKGFVAAKDGFVLGTYYKAGEPVPVSEAQAKYLAPPFGDALTTDQPKPAAKPAVKSEKATD